MMQDLRSDRSEVGVDDLDEAVGGSVAPSVGLRDVVHRTRAALGLRPVVAPAVLFVPIGIALGPLGTDLLSLDLLGHLYPVIAIALAALGIFVGLGVGFDRGHDQRLLGLASLEAFITIAVVAAAFFLLLNQWQLPLGGPVWSLALVLGICAAATANDSAAHRAAMRMADLDDVLPILVGGAVLAVTTAVTLWASVGLLLLNIVVPLTIAIAGWLLFELADDPGERGVFVLGVVALLGGSAVYLGVSPLLAGMAAGVFWRHAPGEADAIIRDDLRRLQHPLVVLLLIYAGALAPLGQLGVMLAVVHVLTRFSGKLLGGALVARAFPNFSPADLGSYLLSPGVVGLGFALSFHLVEPSVSSAAALTAVAVGTVASEVLAALAIVGPSRS